MSKLLKYRLTLDVDFDPQGTTKKQLERNLNQVIKDAVNNGTLTGETEATVEHYSFTVAERVDRQPGQHLFADCGGVPRCVTCGCDEDDAYVGGQDCTYGEEISEQQRRDEKRGLYGDKVDDAN